jgi:site-specific DNA recombinase
MASLTAHFQYFAKQGHAPQVELTSAVIYTRVSTKEQADKNHSLDTQQRYCREYADRKGYTVVAEFGGTYESAKGDERREFKQLLAYVHKQRVGCIIVYSLDRFSRSGANAISIASELRKVGVALESVTQPTDARTSAGELFQNMGLSFSHYDNQQRRDKAITGMREKLRRGCWVGRPPLGYGVVHHPDEAQRLTITPTGRKLRQAFEWKANQVPNTEIVRRLRAQGVSIQLSNLKTIFRNPFYCGLLTHSLLPGELIPSRHPTLISQEVFLRVNEIQPGKQPGYEVSTEVPQMPLKQHVRCGKCAAPLTGYQVKAKNLWYYKCNTKGCQVNVSAKALHTQYEELLAGYTLPDHLVGPLSVQLAAVFAQLNQEQAQQRVNVQQQLQQVEQNLINWRNAS